MGVGLWGNKEGMPRSKAQELAPIVIDAVLGPKAEQLRARVRQLAALCDETPGVSVAASAILEEMNNKKQ